ncbi:MAG: hypothetical protein Q9227_005159 [Pyrenula ochraceoflavens]
MCKYKRRQSSNIVLVASDIACHKSATPGLTYIPVTAGSTIQLEWSPQPWPDSHKGPVIDYLAPCKQPICPSNFCYQSSDCKQHLLIQLPVSKGNGDCTKTTAASLKFTKIDGTGVITPSPAPGYWASDKLASQNNTWPVQIPASLAPGNYVLRHEIIALHGGETLNGAQNYPQCVNLQVKGSGTTQLTGGVAGSSLYKATDPGILFNIYTSFSSYPVPGPAVQTIKKVKRQARQWLGFDE